MQPSAFTVDVEIHLPGVPTPLVERTAVLAAIDFCQRTEAVYRTVEAVAVAATTNTFTLPIDAQTLVQAVKRVTWNNQFPPLRPSQSKMMHAWLQLTGDPRAYSQMNAPTEATTQFRLYPTPQTAGSLQVTYTLMPVNTASVLPDELMRFYETVLHGTVGRLAAMPERSWTNQTTAQQHWRQFFAGCSSAKVDAAAEFIGAEQMVDARPFA